MVNTPAMTQLGMCPNSRLWRYSYIHACSRFNIEDSLAASQNRDEGAEYTLSTKGGRLGGAKYVMFDWL